MHCMCRYVYLYTHGLRIARLDEVVAPTSDLVQQIAEVARVDALELPVLQGVRLA